MGASWSGQAEAARVRRLELQSFRTIEDRAIAVGTLVACVPDGGFARLKEPGLAPGRLANNPQTRRIGSKQEGRRNGPRRPVGKVDAVYEVEGHGTLSSLGETRETVVRDRIEFQGERRNRFIEAAFMK
jgi:hypothetical protein